MGQRDTTYGHDDDMQGVEMHFQSPWLEPISFHSEVCALVH